MSAGPALLELRRLEAARDIASIMSKVSGPFDQLVKMFDQFRFYT